jgi:hypothetical protein
MNLEKAIDFIIIISRAMTFALLLVAMCALLGAFVISLTL